MVRTITAETLSDKYTVSVNAARHEFDGNDLIVKGYVLRPVAMPRNDEEEGMVLLGSEKGVATGVQCWFTKYESAAFVGIAPGDLVKVKGLFSGESAPSLKFCKLIKGPSSDDD